MAARLSERLFLSVLPVEVICEGVLPYLSVRDFQALDTAFTNKLHRPHLSSMWKSYQWSRFEVILSYDELMFLYAREVRLSAVHTQWSLKNDKFSSLIMLELVTDFPHSFDDSKLLDLVKLCPLLELLHLPYGNYSDVGITALAQHCQKLHTITLHSNCITDRGIQALCDHCPHLQHIDVTYCSQLTDASLMTIASTYSRLQSINIYACEFTDDALIFFADKCHELQSVAACSNNITSRGLTALWAANPNITTIDIGAIFDVAIPVHDNDVFVLSQYCPELLYLTLPRSDDVTDFAVFAVAEHCPQLRLLDIRDFANISDVSLIALGQHCHELKSINISLIENITDVGVAALAAGCPLLQEFSARHTRITDAGVIALAQGCRDLQKIDVCGCGYIGFESISAIAKNCPLIAEVEFPHCNLDDASLFVLADHCRNIDKLSILQATYSDAAVERISRFCRKLCIA